MQSKISTERSIPLDRPLEFALFSRSVGYLRVVSEAQVRARVLIRELQETLLVADPLFPEEWAAVSPFLHPHVPLELLFPYKQHSLIFPTRLTANPGKDGTLLLEKPPSGLLTNRRRYPRVTLMGRAPSPWARLEVKSQVGICRFVSRALSDVSTMAMGLFLERSEGLALPGDSVTSLEILCDEEPVLTASARVLRVDMKRRSPGSSSSYFVVLGFSAEAGALTNESPVDRRRTERAPLAEERAAFVQFRNPLFPDRELQGPVMDLSSTGIRFLTRASSAPILPGMIIRGLQLQIAMRGTHSITVKVRNTRPVQRHDGVWCEVGGELVNISAETFKLVSQTVQTTLDPKLMDAGSEDHDSLWEFLFETGFIYGSKRRQLQGYSERLFHTYRALLQSTTPIVKKILYKEDNEIKGHVSAVRFFDDAWLIQHLNALKSKESQSAAQAVVRAMTNFFLDPRANESVGSNFITCFYRPDNLYPSLVFGEVKNLVRDSRLCDLEELNFCLPRSEPLARASGEVSVRGATAEDLESLESLLIESGRCQLLRIEGLTRSGLTRLKVSDEFARIGLYRRREVLVAESKLGARAFAVCNLASPGINLSELTNSSRIYYERADSPANEELARALAHEILALYAASDVKQPVLLVEPSLSVPAPFEVKKIYRYWFHDANRMELFRDATTHIFANIKELLKEWQKNHGETAVG